MCFGERSRRTGGEAEQSRGRAVTSAPPAASQALCAPLRLWGLSPSSSFEGAALAAL